MMDSRYGTSRVLAIDPTYRGFGYAIFEGPESLVAWGVKYASGDLDVQRTSQLARLIACYEPDILVIEDCEVQGNRRRNTARTYLELAAAFAAKQQITVRRVARKNVLETFGPASTKYRVAVTLAEHFHGLRERLPRERKPWQSEDERMSIFDAVAFAWTFLHPATPTV
jgi:hypothetical protein